jgi:hypothetical protein
VVRVRAAGEHECTCAEEPDYQAGSDLHERTEPAPRPGGSTGRTTK